MAVWWGQASTVGKPSWTVLSYHVIDDRDVDVTYLVSRPSGRDVTCVIRAWTGALRRWAWSRSTSRVQTPRR